MTFTVTPSSVSTTPTFLNYQVAGATNSSGSIPAAQTNDFPFISGSVVVPANAASATFTVTPSTDSVVEGFEGFKVTLLDSSFNTVATSNTLVVNDAAASATGGQVFTLTTASDNSGTLVGSSGTTNTTGDDTFNGVIDQAAATNTTINVGDVINGGTGTDTLNITGVGLTLDVLNSATVSGIETLNIRATTANTINASQLSGLTAVNANLGTGTVIATSLATGASIGVIGNGTVANGEVAFAYATSTAAPTLNISGGTAMTAAITNKATLGGTSTFLPTTVTVNSLGTVANTVGTVDFANASLTSITVNAAANLTGDFFSETTDQVGTAGSLTISGGATSVSLTANLDNTITTINAAGLTAGGLTAILGTGVTTFTGGLGNDVITTAATTTAGAVIAAGAGTADKLILAATNDVSTSAKAAQYTGFEILQANNSQDVSLFSGLTAIELGATTSKTVSGLSAALAANIKVVGDTAAAVTFSLANATGTADVLGLTLGTGLTTANATNLATSLVTTGFETVNLTTNAGPTASAAQVSTIGAITDANLKNLNLYGAGFTIADAATTLATTIDGSALTGVLTLGGNLVAGSVVTGGAGADVFTAGNVLGSTYNGGNGNDKLTATVAALVASGGNDTKYNGGAGTDNLTISDVGATLTDNHFTWVTNAESLTFTTGAVTLTTGSAFNGAFPLGVTVTDGVTATTSALSYNLGLATIPVTLTSTGGSQTGATTENVTITTGSANDTVTWGATGWVGVAGTGGAVVISTGAGNDTITASTGTLLAQTTAIPVKIVGGLGADTIDATTHVNGGTTGNFVYTIADGDSLAASRDKITGFKMGTGALFSDTLDFDGTPTIQADTAGTNGTDAGSLRSHAITGGLVTFSSADTFGSLVTINSSNLTDAVTYLTTNITTNIATVMFGYDSDSNGAVDATIVYNKGAATASVVELVALIGVSLNATNATTAGLLDLG